jgi:HK97 family phage portal protein
MAADLVERSLRPPVEASPASTDSPSPAVAVSATPTITSSEPPPITPQRWAGWPSAFGDPWWGQSWGRIEELTDTAWAGLDLNASVIATMPPYLVNAAESLNADWMINPDPSVYADWTEFAKELFWDFQTGEAFVMPTSWYSTGWPSRFHVVSPWRVTADIKGGLRRYRIGTNDVTGQILHVRYKSTVGDAHGKGPLEVGRSRVIAANALNRYATELAASGGIPYAVLVHGDELTAEQAAALQWQWVDRRIAAMGLPGVLSGGIELKTLSIDPEKMAWLDLARYEEARLAVLLQIPPPLLGLPSGQDSLTYNTATMIRIQHWQAGLKTKVARVMGALSQWALPRGTHVELNQDEYIKPDPLERAQTNAILFTSGVISREEWREMERFTNSAPTETLTAGVLQ